MLIIRFSRVGKRNHAQYKIVLAEKSYPIKGKFNELLGSYDPHLKQASLKEERISHWLSKGAACSDSVHNLFVEKGLIKGDKRKVTIKQKKKQEGEEAAKEGETKPGETVGQDKQTTAEKPAAAAEKQQEAAEPAKEKIEEQKTPQQEQEEKKPEKADREGKEPSAKQQEEQQEGKKQPTA